MTVRELVSFLKLYVSYPEALGNLEIVNEGDFCRYPMIDYFSSESFLNDMRTAYEIFKDEGYKSSEKKFYFIFERNEFKDFSLKLKSYTFKKDENNNYSLELKP